MRELTSSASKHEELQKEFSELSHREALQADKLAEVDGERAKLEETLGSLRSTMAVQDVKYRETRDLLEQERKEVVSGQVRGGASGRGELVMPVCPFDAGPIAGSVEVTTSPL